MKSTNLNTDKLISKALRCLEDRLKYVAGEVLTNSRNVCDYLRLQLAEEKTRCSLPCSWITAIVC
jgi:hypothetical protein